MTAPRIHLDHNASTPVDPRVLAVYIEIEQRYPANPGSLHASGRAARAALEDARARVAATLDVAADAVVFVASGTEANNIVVLGAGPSDLPVLLAEIEHPSVLEAARRRGCLTWDVAADASAIVREPTAPVGLLCLAHAQNEIGTLQPIAAAGELARTLGVPLHVDASQTLGRHPLDDALENATTLTLSAHKAGGLRGCSVLVTRGALRPLMFGGGQEAALRPGTPSPALAAATALAIELAVEEHADRAARMRAARDAFLGALDVAHRLLTPARALANTAMVTFDGVDGRLLLPALDMAGVEASQGSACSAGSPTPPRVLHAIGLRDDETQRCVRFSTSKNTSVDDARDAARRVNRVVVELAK